MKYILLEIRQIILYEGTYIRVLLKKIKYLYIFQIK